ncbi:hypothetical protein P8891_05655 [Bacillus atrophaeus]|uniref:hypothetical protein n=1 Tax=Bacillus atrophaeus TaxID=1452 RepID=UPI002282802C|nr:hypothetical protein [Bacillus atrophaeus]MCY7947958.1 hypothetical protein [Bacillus atrophaeus]MCY8098243.1 hypothetical protein [Bacillus atrophaeus]MCY9170020.1 hypothetical protein [Bacillus atrophaeus]MEC0740573.1 hypothetical protein [Bacillus atrophaeus]MEC0746991.1 hypothetical protein [Bacillus atrophaeus]
MPYVKATKSLIEKLLEEQNEVHLLVHEKGDNPNAPPTIYRSVDTSITDISELENRIPKLYKEFSGHDNFNIAVWVTEVWNISTRAYEPMPKRVKDFLDEIEEVCSKYNFDISHEDGHGAFIIEECEGGGGLGYGDPKINIK